MLRSIPIAAFATLAAALLVGGAFGLTLNVPLTVWEHGFMIGDDGQASCAGRVPPTYYHVIGARHWFTYTVDLTRELPNPVYIDSILVGGDGWDFEGYWDNVRLEIDGVDLIRDGRFSTLKGWDQSGFGRGAFLYDDVNIGDTHGSVAYYRRTDSLTDGGGAFLRQAIRVCVENPAGMTFSGEVYLINQSLPNPGWWCCVYDCAPEHGEYPGEVRVVYSAVCPPGSRGHRVSDQPGT